METEVDQLTIDMFTSQSLERHTKRLIAAVLSDRESFTGVKDKRSAQIVKDIANYSKRIMLTKLTGLEIESIHANNGRRDATDEQNTPDDGGY